jgi:hypothetical protein
MFVAIPYHPDLPASYGELIVSIKKAGTNPGHTLAVVSLREHDDEAYLFGNALADYFGRHVKISVEERPENRVQMSNRFFTAALSAFDRYKPGQGETPDAPLLYMDPSYRPTSPRWLDELQSAYFQKGAPMVYGVPKKTDIPAFLGPVILNRSFKNTSSLMAFMPPDHHWRDYLAWEMVKNSVKADGIGTHESAVLVPTFEI